MRAFTPHLVRYLATVADPRRDGDLLAGFLIRHSQSDFAELVRRHGPMVWGVCRRALPDQTDAEDAFQTAFLVLVQRGNRLTGYASVGPWLHRVAVWTARNLRRRNARQRAKRVQLPEQLSLPTTDADLQLDLDAALLSLPEKFRAPIVLCHLLGYSRAEAAAKLGCAERTLSSWLACGLAQLRHKLRGLNPTKALAIAAATVPLGLTDAVVRAAISLRTTAVAAAVLSSSISKLIEGVIHMFWLKKATAATVALLAVFAFGIGIGVSTHQLAPAVGGQEKVGGGQPTGNRQPTQESDLASKIAQIEEKIREAKQEVGKIIHEVKEAQNVLKELFLAKSEDRAEVLKQLVQLEAKFKAAQKKLEILVSERVELLHLQAQKSLTHALEQEVKFEGNINETQLIDLLNLLSKRYDIPFVILEEDFKAEKITNIKAKKPSLPSATKLTDLKLGAFLDLVLGSMNAAYIVRADSIEITTLHKKQLMERATRAPHAVDESRDLLQAADNTLGALQSRLAKVQAEADQAKAEAQRAQARSAAVKAEIQAIAAAIALKEKQKAAEATGPSANKPTGAYLQLIVDAKEKTWPFLVKEFGPDGRPLGATAFENAEVFGRYLARTLKDPAGPKELRLARGTPHSVYDPVAEICKATGFKVVVVATAGDKAAPLDNSLENHLRWAEEVEKLYRLKEATDLRGRELADQHERLRKLEEELRKQAEKSILPGVTADELKQVREREEQLRKVEEQRRRLVEEELRKQAEKSTELKELRDYYEKLWQPGEPQRKLQEKVYPQKPVEIPKSEKP